MDPEMCWGERKCAVIEKASSSISTPRHADSPTSASSQTTSTSTTSDTELKDALIFMRKFLNQNNQDTSEKLKFLDYVDFISTTLDSDKKERFGDYHCNPSLLRDTLKFLLPESSSPYTRERILALSRITKVICCITRHCIVKGMKDFKIGEVAACLTLCCSDPDENVCNWAADGLHRLYTLIMHQKGLTKTEDDPEYREILQEWEEEKIFWLAWFSDVSFTTMIFKKYLRPDDQMAFIVTAIKGLRDNAAHSTKAALHMLKAMLRDPKPNFVKVPKTIKFLYYNLEHISNAQARHEVLRFLCLLGDSHPQEVVKALLDCSLQCDCSATAMWLALTAFTEPSTKVLNELQSTLLERPLQVTSTGMKPSLGPLAATAALYEILKCPSPACKEILKSMYPSLSISLLCHISYTIYLTPHEIDTYWRTCIQQKIPTPVVPFRSALVTFKALVRRVSSGDEALVMNKRRGSELLLHRSTHQKGIALFARVLIRNQRNEHILPHLMAILDTKENQIHITVLTFLVELLVKNHLSNEATEDIIQQLCKQLKAHRVELRSLALSGLLHLTIHPEKMVKLKHALPDILARLRDTNREVNVKALKLLPHVLKSLDSEELNIFTMEVAARVIPLFDDASNKVRLAAISTFSSLFELIRKGGKQPMKEFALQSLVPLMIHLHDESPSVTQACWIALRRADRFLKSFIQTSIQDNEVWSFCTSLVKRYREQAEGILMEQAFSYLENPRQGLREGAIKLLEIIGQETNRKETVNAIATVLNLVSLEAKASGIYLAASEIMENMGREPSGNVFGRFLNRIRIWRRLTMPIVFLTLLRFDT